LTYYIGSKEQGVYVSMMERQGSGLEPATFHLREALHGSLFPESIGRISLGGYGDGQPDEAIIAVDTVLAEVEAGFTTSRRPVPGIRAQLVIS
jgi:hypothetical protein